MTKAEIINGNQLIAEFMNEKNDSGYYFFSFKKDEFRTGYVYKNSNSYLYFHSNWLWLMSVVEKIESLGYGFHKDPFKLRIIDYTTVEEAIIVCFEKNDNTDLIVWYYLTVVDFVKWFNKFRKEQ